MIYKTFYCENFIYLCLKTYKIKFSKSSNKCQSIYNHLLFLILKKIFKSMLVFKIGHLRKNVAFVQKSILLNILGNRILKTHQPRK